MGAKNPIPRIPRRLNYKRNQLSQITIPIHTTFVSISLDQTFLIYDERPHQQRLVDWANTDEHWRDGLSYWAFLWSPLEFGLSSPVDWPPKKLSCFVMKDLLHNEPSYVIWGWLQNVFCSLITWSPHTWSTKKENETSTQPNAFPDHSGPKSQTGTWP